jgi:aspartyl-tRNA(Asn)/glutamyl-tRNA(Gln) amidotransferase subunit A
MQNLLDLKRRLESGRILSRDLVEESLAKIDDPAGEGARSFVAVNSTRARKEADLVDEARRHGLPVPDLAGVPISIKDLFDCRGEVTRAGSRVLENEQPAATDADAVSALRRAGFIIVGRNNMTEFAYSGLGLNAHFGTPLNPFERTLGRIPGGSTSGGAVAVSDGMAPAALGTDTGGSCRIPAAFCGVVGFKPTARRVSRRGVIPLSETLDSVGPLAGSVSCCAILDAVLSTGTVSDEDSHPEVGLCLGVIEGYVDEKLDDAVAAAYSAALTRLSQRGVRLKPVSIPELAELPEINRNGGLISAEAYAWHRTLLQTRAELYDPWVRARFDAGRAQSAADYIDVLRARSRLIARVQERSRVFDALVLPTVQIVAPTIESVKDHAVSTATNLLCLRNTAIGNFLDRPAISIPCHPPGSAPVGCMLMGETMEDRRLLSIARGLECAIRQA